MRTELSNPRRKDNADVRVSVTNNKKAEYDKQQFLGHSKPAEVPETDKANFSGKDSRVLSHETTGPDVGATVHSQAVSVPGASPNRVRRSEPQLVRENGTSRLASVSNIPKKETDEKAAADADKVKLFSRPSSGNSDALPHPSLSGRDWNSTDAPAPNRKER
jgi:hypothetical protein